MTVHFQAIQNGVLNPDLEMPELFQFPGGEWHLHNVPTRARLFSTEPQNVIEDEVEWVAVVHGADTNDYVAAALLGDMARQRGENFYMLVPYLPAARADRGNPLGARVYADLINNCGGTVYTLDAHSDTMPDLVDFCHDLPVIDIIGDALASRHRTYDAVISPDKGAVDRAGAVATILGVDLHIGEKRRDFSTGRIYKLEVPRLPENGRYLVVDDICDGGRTFMELAIQSGFRTMDLWVTHGIFSGDAPNLRNFYEEIFTTNSHPGHNRVGVATHIEPVWPYMFKHILDRIAKRAEQ
ncbi:phosphoribosyltransferase family protein [Mycolicibacterium sphagni]|uniref:phosphoribosyltransferase family protein n=1 Tax=Mycolicibacterium sphagni TaxID=1786 RepID=UPI0021F2ACE0|nr:phosphoribosyltransferase family protein [Mycolicibacterium sphagni]MCV7174909.1 ribose-phosphate pyrophosphokinase [Mycolicibacterium sphagni]